MIMAAVVTECSVYVRSGAWCHWAATGEFFEMPKGFRAKIRFMSPAWVWVVFQGRLVKTHRKGADICNDHFLERELRRSDDWRPDVDTVSLRRCADGA